MHTAQVIPFRFEAREVRTIVIDDQPWFCASDVCEVLGYANSRQAIQKNCRAEGVSIRDTLTRGGRQALTFITEGNLYRLIIKSRKEEAQRFETWVCDEVLPEIRKHGRYEDAENRMATLLGQTIGTDGFHCLAAVVDGKVRHLNAAQRRSAKNHIWSQVHKAFSVVTAEDIPAAQLDSARNFVAAYSIEGEWLPKQANITENDARDWQHVNCLINSISHSYRIMGETQLSRHLSALGCSAGMEILSFLHDAMGSCGHLNKHRAAELDAGARSVGWKRKIAQ
jgi:prophage antirepressor-like protein